MTETPTSSGKHDPSPEQSNVIIRVEDDRTGMSPETLRRAVLDHLTYTCSKDLRSATPNDVYLALAHTVRDRLVGRWMHTQRTYADSDPKRAFYLSAEFLVGRLLSHNLINLGIYSLASEGLKEYGQNLTDILEEEPDPGLGNGGLGRLAACFLDSMATMSLPAHGYGIRYEYGIFRQIIRDGVQIERPDAWLRYGNPWEIPRPEYTVAVQFGGHVEQRIDDGVLSHRWHPSDFVLGVPYDYPVAGYGVQTVNTLRLWSARASEEFDLRVFNAGDFRRAVEHKTLSESISKVLYPNDQSREGRSLRLKQQYFFVACSLADIMRRYKRHHDTFDKFPSKVAIQLNDTHPAIAVAELMRILLDFEHLPWDEAWSITQRSVAYTNHTLLPEALEKWPVSLFEELLPRHLQIIYEINHRFLRHVHVTFPGDDERKARMSIIGEGHDRVVRMAHLAVVGSHSVNGVAELHSELVRTDLLKDFAELWPERFNNKTNGVTPRRWLLQCNPRLAELIRRRIGKTWVRDLAQLKQLAPLASDAGFCEELAAIKRRNKEDLAARIQRMVSIHVNVDSIFDVQIKRIHEYKRQILNCLRTIALYHRVRFEGRDIVPRTILFGGKAAPGYMIAKEHIRLIHDVAEIINNDPAVEDRLRVVFMPNYSVSLAESIIPAADISQQISLAGMEASGTGNMKFQMNGALTVGTLDGANIEIREEVGADNFFLFGLHADEVATIKAHGYDPTPYIAKSPTLQAVLDLIERGFFSPDEPERHRPIARGLRQLDSYLVCADFDAYLACQDHAADVYLDRQRWQSMVVANIASSGKFSSDRTIADYSRDIWQLDPVSIDFDEPPPPASRWPTE